MLFHLIAAIVAVVLIALVWTLSFLLWAGLSLALWLTLVVLALVGVAYLIRLLIRRAGPADAATAAALQAVDARWRELVAGLHAAHVGEQVLRRCPWFVVLGATGSGKTSLLQESGLPWTSVGGTVVPARAVMPTGAFGVWRTDDAAFIDIPGKWTDDRRCQTEWLRLLRLVRRTRGRQALSGVVVCVDVGELVRKGEQNIAHAAQALRDRCQEVATAIGLALPLYVVFTRADAVGGFKDFFGGATNAEKAQVLGCTLTWPVAGDPPAVWAAEQEALIAALRKRRLHALSQAKGDEGARKLFQFPIQLHAAGRLLHDFLVQLLRPGAREGATLRGVYFTSSFQPAQGSANAAAVAAAVGGSGPSGRPGGIEGGMMVTGAPTAPAATQPPASVPQDMEKSFFLQSAGGSSPAGSTTLSARGGQAEARIGWFIRTLLGKVLPGDRVLARPTRSAQRWAYRLRVVGLLLVPLAALVVAGWSVVGAISDRALVAAVRDRAHELELPVDPADPKQVERATIALDTYGAALVALADADGRLHAAAEAAAKPWLRRLQQLYLDPALQRLQRDLEEVLRAGAADRERQVRLTDLFNAYRMLTQARTPTNRDLLNRVLVRGERRWFGAVERGGPLLPETEQRAVRQLDRLAERLLPYGIGVSSPDPALMDRIRREFGDALWVTDAYQELLASLQPRFETARSLFADDERAGVILGEDFSLVFSQSGWNDAVRVAIDEKAEQVARQVSDMDLRRDVGRIAEQLRAIYRDEHVRRWRNFIAGTRLAAPRSADQAPGFIERATGPQSPWRPFIRRALDQMALDVSGSMRGAVERRIPTDWIDPALRVVGDLRSDVARWLGEGAGRADPAKAADLAKRFDEAAKASATQLALIDRREVRDAVVAGLENLVRSLWEPIDRELGGVCDRRWREQVLPVWQRDYAGRFPFAESDQEVELPAFARLLNPNNGLLVQATAPIEQLRRQRIADRSALTVSDAFAATMTRVETMRTVLFSGGDQVAAAAEVVLEGRESIRDMILTVGKQSFRLNDRIDFTYAPVLRQDEPPGSSLKVQLRVNNEWPAVSFAGRPWGLVRLLRSGGPQAQGDGRWRLVWRFTVPGAPQPFEAQAYLKPNGFEKAVVGDLLSGFTCPESLLPTDDRYGAADAR